MALRAGPQFGPEAVALNRDLIGTLDKETEILKALCAGGGEWVGASIVYDQLKHQGDLGEEEAKTLKAVLIDAMCAKSDRAIQRWQNVLAIVQIISFWRRLAAMPDSKAARRAANNFYETRPEKKAKVE